MRIIYPHGIDLHALRGRVATGDLTREEALEALGILLADAPVVVSENDAAHGAMRRRGTHVAVCVFGSRSPARLRA